MFQPGDAMGIIVRSQTRHALLFGPGQVRTVHKLDKQLSFLSVVIAGAWFFFLVTQFWPFTVDDAFITFRYSENLARGIGPTYNAQLPRIEGYTSFLYVILMSVPHLLRIDAVPAAKVIGIICSLVTLAVTFLLAFTFLQSVDIRTRILAASLAIFCLAFFPFTALHSVAGMDTMLFSMFFVSATFLVFYDRTSGSIWVALAALLMGLTRPEGNLAALSLIIGNLFLLPKGRRVPFIRYVLLLYILPGVLYFLWRWMYYGCLFPLPFYLKVKDEGVLNGLLPVLSFVKLVSVPLGTFLLLACLRFPKRFLIAGIPCLVLLAFFLFPSHIMGYGHRFLFPTFPLFAALAGIGAVVLLDFIERTIGRTQSRVAYVFVLILWSVIVTDNARGMIQGYRAYAGGLEQAHIRLGKTLSELDGDGNELLVIGDAGAVPYYSKWETFDSYGLNNPHIARTGDRSPGAISSQDPSVVVLLSKKPDGFEPLLPWEDSHYIFFTGTGMTKLLTLRFSSSYFLWVLGYPDAAVSRRLIELHSQRSAGR